MATIEIRGLDKVLKKLRKYPEILEENMSGAGQESSEMILDSEGLRNYPPETAANLPPTPYYIRGRGMQYRDRNDYRSERYGTKWNVEQDGYRTKIGNVASYAKYLGGEKQSEAMARIGWRKLWDTAKEKQTEIKRIYVAWIDRASKAAGLK